MGVHVGINDPRRNAVDPDAGRPQFLCKGTGHADKTGLCGGIGRFAGGTGDSPDGRNVENSSVFLVNHMGKRRLDAVIGAGQGGVQHFMPFCGSQVGKKAEPGNSRIVDENIHTAAGGEHSINL